MARVRAQALIIRDGAVLFGYGKVKAGGFRHFFLGGGVEAGESADQAVLREVREEAGVRGSIRHRFSREIKPDHATYLVDIGEETPVLGCDPEEVALPLQERCLQKLIWISLDDAEEFTSIDHDYFELLLAEVETAGLDEPWIDAMRRLVDNPEGEGA